MELPSAHTVSIPNTGADTVLVSEESLLSGGRLMRPGVESGRFEVLPHVRHDPEGLGGQRRRRMLHDAVDIVDPEPDPFQVEGGDCPAERFRFLDQADELVARGCPADDGQQVVEAVLRRLAIVGGHDATIVRPDRVEDEMEKGRGRIEAPDLSEKGGLKEGVPQRSDDRLFMQLLAFGQCDDAAAVARQLEGAGIEGVVYEDLNDPRGIGVLSLDRSPDVFVERVRPELKKGACGGMTLKPEFTMFGRTYPLGYEPDLNETLIERPRRTALNASWPWAIWYPLRRSGRFAQLPEQEQRAILAEHGTIGMAFGAADYA